MSALEKSQTGLALLKEAILQVITENSEGIGNADIARMLKIQSDYEGEKKNYLSWSVLGILVNEGKVVYEKYPRKKLYFLKSAGTK